MYSLHVLPTYTPYMYVLPTWTPYNVRAVIDSADTATAWLLLTLTLHVHIINNTGIDRKFWLPLTGFKGAIRWNYIRAWFPKAIINDLTIQYVLLHVCLLVKLFLFYDTHFYFTVHIIIYCNLFFLGTLFQMRGTLKWNSCYWLNEIYLNPRLTRQTEFSEYFVSISRKWKDFKNLQYITDNTA